MTAHERDQRARKQFGKRHAAFCRSNMSFAQIDAAIKRGNDANQIQPAGPDMSCEEHDKRFCQYLDWRMGHHKSSGLSYDAIDQMVEIGSIIPAV